MNKPPYPYLMEHPNECVRLDIKTNREAVKSQAAWCDIKPGIRVLDVGCGSGKTASILHDMIQPNGVLIGIDRSEDRVAFAQKKYGNKPGLDFLVRDFTRPLEGLAPFDVIWVRFVLEYFRKDAYDIVRNIAASLKPGGCLCLLDLDYNCMNHYPFPDLMQTTLQAIMERLESKHNFDPYAGRKLFSHLYNLEFDDIEANLTAHHLIYGKLQPQDQFNWIAKLKMLLDKTADLFERYPGGSKGFLNDFSSFLDNPGRFIYTPLILVKGKKPLKANDRKRV